MSAALDISRREISTMIGPRDVTVIESDRPAIYVDHRLDLVELADWNLGGRTEVIAWLRAVADALEEASA